MLEAIDDPAVRRPVEAEKAFLDELGGGCTFPVGAHAEVVGPRTGGRSRVARSVHRRWCLNGMLARGTARAGPATRRSGTCPPTRAARLPATCSTSPEATAWGSGTTWMGAGPGRRGRKAGSGRDRALVGAGPGDPELVTVRGAALLARADVIIYDRLIAHSLLDLAPPGAERIDVGKRQGPPARLTSTRCSSNTARAGSVVRLKGGDPFLFGRGGEEAEALQTAGIPYDVVPGVTSAFAAPAAAGIPVTHRGLSTSVTVVTGHVGDPSAPGGVDWRALAQAGGTLVVMMGMADRARIAEALIDGGRPGRHTGDRRPLGNHRRAANRADHPRRTGRGRSSGAGHHRDRSGSGARPRIHGWPGEPTGGPAA